MEKSKVKRGPWEKVAVAAFLVAAIAQPYAEASTSKTKSLKSAAKTAGKLATPKGTVPKAVANPKSEEEYLSAFNDVFLNNVEPSTTPKNTGGADQIYRMAKSAKLASKLVPPSSVYGNPINANWAMIKLDKVAADNPLFVAMAPSCVGAEAGEQGINRGTFSSITTQLALQRSPGTPQALEMYFRSRQTIDGTEVAGDWHKSIVMDNGKYYGKPVPTTFGLQVPQPLISANAFGKIKEVNIDIGITPITALPDAQTMMFAEYDTKPAKNPPLQIIGSLVIGTDINCHWAMNTGRGPDYLWDNVISRLPGNYNPISGAFPFPSSPDMHTDVLPYSGNDF